MRITQSGVNNVAERVMLVYLARPDVIDTLRAGDQLRGLIGPGADVARRWEAAPMSTRREIARLLTPDLIGELRITPLPGRGHRVPAEDHIQWWRG